MRPRPPLAPSPRSKQPRGAGQGEESLPPSWGKVRMGGRPARARTSPPSPARARRRRPPPSRHSCEGMNPDGRGTPTTNPVVSPTPLPHRRGDSRIAHPARAATSPPSPGPARRRRPPPSRHSCEGRNPEGRGAPVPPRTVIPSLVVPSHKGASVIITIGGEDYCTAGHKVSLSDASSDIGAKVTVCGHFHKAMAQLHLPPRTRLATCQRMRTTQLRPT